ENGLTAKNGTYFADFKKFYQNVYPGNGPLSGAVNPTDTLFNRAAYNHMTNRQNTFNDTDFIYKGFTGPLFHTIGFGTELGRQAGIDVRNTGLFPNGTNTERRGTGSSSRWKICRSIIPTWSRIFRPPATSSARSPTVPSSSSRRSSSSGKSASNGTPC